MNSCTSGRSIVKMPALPTPTKKRKNIRKSQPGTKPSCSGVNTMRPVASEMVIVDMMNTVTGGKQDCPALPIGQRPLLGQRRGDVADQEEIKEIEQICKVGRADQLP